MRAIIMTSEKNTSGKKQQQLQDENHIEARESELYKMIYVKIYSQCEYAKLSVSTIFFSLLLLKFMRRAKAKEKESTHTDT